MVFAIQLHSHGDTNQCTKSYGWGGGEGGGAYIEHTGQLQTNHQTVTGVLDETVEVANLRCFRAIPSAILALTVVF